MRVRFVYLLFPIAFTFFFLGWFAKPETRLATRPKNTVVIPTITPVPSLQDIKEVKGVQTVARPSNGLEEAIVVKVVDGDTIKLDNGKTVRYIGINTPETVDPRSSVECFGKEASFANSSLVLGKKVKMEKDVSETDRFGRLLRYVYVDDVFVNDHLVRQGYGRAASFPPDVRYQDEFRSAEKEARGARRGLWNQCGP